jgi:glycosyltransferase involved in cell wall biosynthesis
VIDRAPGNRAVIFYKSIPQYRGRFYELLRERLAADGVELVLVYGDPSREDASKADSIDLDWATRRRTLSLRAGDRELLWQGGLTRVRRGDLVIVEQASKLLLNYVLFTLARTGYIRFAFWGHGRSTRLRALTSAGERAKAFMSRRAWWWFAYNERSAGFVLELGYPDDRITRVQNAIDTRELIAAARRCDDARLDQLRAELGLRGDNVCVFVGAMYPDKRLPFLIAACEAARSRLPDFEMIFIGEGPESGIVTAAATEHDWIHQVGPKFNDERVPYMLLAKFVLMPGLVGLGVLDSFALRVPLITTRIPYHSPEIDYLRDGENGLMVFDAPDPDRYARAVVAALLDEPLRERLRQGCEESSGRYTVEEMADNFARGVLDALACPTRPAPGVGSCRL